MPNHQRSAVAAMHAALRGLAGEAITIRRKGKDAIKTTGVAGGTPIETIGDDGVAITSQAADWIVSAAAYNFGDGPVLPQRNDEIDWIDAAGVTHTYTVLPRGEDRCYRFTDQTRVQLRVHVVERTPNPQEQQ